MKRRATRYLLLAIVVIASFGAFGITNGATEVSADDPVALSRYEREHLRLLAEQNRLLQERNRLLQRQLRECG